MSILKRNYEISIWDDVLIGENFQEVRWGVIGSDKMLSQSRAINPKLGRNVNGSKTFSFDMYRFYTDNVTGERVENPFAKQLISERKVKLKYKNKWYDFIVKDINENSATHLCTYQLDDAAVVELSKNGFGVILDEQKNNNLGNPATLAMRVLEGTDWKVESEVLVQKVEDALVYVSIPPNTPAIQLVDQSKSDLSHGVMEKPVSIGENKVDKQIILAFYSSCANKPHRFQFIYLDNLENITTDKEDKINNANCQYYIEFEPSEYEAVPDTPFFLPKEFTLYNKTTGYLYTDARAERYGFAHQTEYSSKLDRYVYKYHKCLYENGQYIGIEKEEDGKTDKTYYGYQDSEYFSPELIQNIVTNSRFDSTAGWIGTRSSVDGEKAVIRNVYGYFSNNKFHDSAEEIMQGKFNPNNSSLAAYLEITFKKDSLVINTGPYDNRISIGDMALGSEWELDQTVLNSNGVNHYSYGPTVSIGEYSYKSKDDYYESPQNTKNIEFSPTISFNNIFYTVTSTTYSEETFKKDSQVYIAIQPATPLQQNQESKYYIKKFDLFRRVTNDDGKVIYPDDVEKQVENLEEGVVKNKYYYFSKEALEEATNESNLKKDFSETLSYTTYKPVYNIGAEKIRSVSAKESNYFNILQSIAETFGAWLEVEVDHNEDGTIKELKDGEGNFLGKAKYVRFKNYIGKTNYANFRYGVNLKDIQRTFASKEIVTKLIVKPNSNQHAKNGFCAIGRAGSNPSGEDYIYDFRYFYEKDLLNIDGFFNDMYVPEKEKDENGEEKYIPPEEYNYDVVRGYYTKIKYLNNQMNNINDDIIIPTQTSLTQLESEYAVAEAGYEAAQDGIRQTRESFQKLVGFSIDNISTQTIDQVEIDAINKYGSYDEDRYGYIHYAEVNGFSVENVEYTKSDKITITYKITEDFSASSVVVRLYPKIRLKNYGEEIVRTQKIEIRPSERNKSLEATVTISLVDQDNSAALKKITEYTTFCGNENLYKKQKSSLQNQITKKKEKLAEAEEQIATLKEYKTKLNLAFFKKYSRFIQEGTWLDEKYHDNELYYADALSVMYNSCYPKVAYTINVIAVNCLPGYEGFEFGLGDTTYVEDREFFGDENGEVVITEYIEFLDEPEKDQIKVQNFKNQFQDLFQKITATVQQAQYSTGSYEKAVALAEANQRRKQEFLTDALNSASARLAAAGQQSVVWDNTGLTITDIDTPSNQIKMIGGAILLKKQDENGQEKWTTGITSDGVSANLITAGILNAGEIAIMNADEPAFRWDVFGISAFDFDVTEENFGSVISPINSNRFVRFDRHGVYGIDGKVDGLTWHPTGNDYNGNAMEEIKALSTFALTWEGLKVSTDKAVLHLGRWAGENGNVQRMIRITKTDGTETFSVNHQGNIEMSGIIHAENGDIGGWEIESSRLISKDKCVGMSTTGQYAFFAGKNSTNHSFCVTHEGKMYAEDCQLKGVMKILDTLMFQTTGDSYSSMMMSDEYMYISKIMKDGQQIILVFDSPAPYQINNQSFAHYLTANNFLINNPYTDSGICIQSYVNRNFTYKPTIAIGHGDFIKRVFPGGVYNTTICIDPGKIPNNSLSGYGELLRNWHIQQIYTDTNPSIDSSDRNKKNSIVALEREYEILFDNIKPVRYKYNNGQSNRIHIGFIAQQVEEALQSASMTSQQFAGLCTWKYDEQGEIHWGLRYTEFIAINTWQIQKLKPRMTAAEEKIKQLELEVTALKQELATFKNQ